MRFQFPVKSALKDKQAYVHVSEDYSKGAVVDLPSLGKDNSPPLTFRL